METLRTTRKSRVGDVEAITWFLLLLNRLLVTIEQLDESWDGSRLPQPGRAVWMRVQGLSREVIRSGNS